MAVEDNRVAVYRASDGRRERFLTERLTPYREVDPSLSADGKSVLYVHAEGQCAGSIRSVPLTGGPSTVLRKRTAGRVPVQPVQSVRGELAYALTSCTHSRYETGAESVLVVGAREIPFAAQHGATIEDIDWTQDGQRIAVLATMGSPGCPDVSGSDTCRYETRIYVFSPSSAQRVDETRPWRGPAPPAGEECGLSAVSFRPTGRLLAGQTCGDPNAESAGLGRVVELDAASSRVLAERLDIVATVDVDATGRSVVLGMLECAETCEDAPAYAQRLRSDGTVRKIANDRAQPNWA
ncbi:MAG TPA: hypothetical protein VNB64_11605 [Solirubrobacteraceae bacterium]|nr:hypothetical protein [Solirubrobacteraceae bacterium]